jgi:glycosyltransferase involved in cell wall biosynthesis
VGGLLPAQKLFLKYTVLEALYIADSKNGNNLGPWMPSFRTYWSQLINSYKAISYRQDANVKKVILIAYALNPNRGSEAGVASAWLDAIGTRFLVDVYADAVNMHDILQKDYPNATFHFITGVKRWRLLARKISVNFLPVTVFYKKVKKELRQLPLSEYALLHCITPAGIYFFNDLYKFGIPMIIGPLGGGLPTPKNFLQVFRHQATKTILRDLFYQYLLKSVMWRQYLNHSIRIIVGTPDVKRRLPEKVHSKCVTIFDTVVDVNTYRPNPDRQQQHTVNILFSGSLESKKGVTLLIKAAEISVNQGVNNFLIQIAGAGSLFQKMKTSIQRRGLSQYVSLIGHLSKSDLLERYRNADIFCLPTLREPGGTAILEAMACGLPIITSNYGGPSYTVTNECGIKIEVHNEAQYTHDLSRALQYLILSNTDVRLRMGKAARQRAITEYSLTAIERKIHALYDEIISHIPPA